MEACCNGRTATAQALLDAGAHIDAKDCVSLRGRRPTPAAAWPLADPPCAPSRCAIWQYDKTGLDYALERNHSEVVVLLEAAQRVAGGAVPAAEASLGGAAAAAAAEPTVAAVVACPAPPTVAAVRGADGSGGSSSSDDDEADAAPAPARQAEMDEQLFDA